ncbi:MAG: hypothetical protein IJV67_03755 [Clostridia bacterium]|nr:hypothetical protein [Clostridia bacterium]
MDRSTQIILDYVEGRIDIVEFKKEVSVNRHLRTYLDDFASSINNCIFGKKTG